MIKMAVWYRFENSLINIDTTSFVARRGRVINFGNEPTPTYRPSQTGRFRIGEFDSVRDVPYNIDYGSTAAAITELAAITALMSKSYVSPIMGIDIVFNLNAAISIRATGPILRFYFTENDIFSIPHANAAEANVQYDTIVTTLTGIIPLRR